MSEFEECVDTFDFPVLDFSQIAWISYFEQKIVMINYLSAV
jgi:hypothetical protein